MIRAPPPPPPYESIGRNIFGPKSLIMAAELGDELRLDVLAAKTATKGNPSSLRPSARSLPTGGGEKSRDRLRPQNPSSSRVSPAALRSPSETRCDGSHDHAPPLANDAQLTGEERLYTHVPCF